MNALPSLFFVVAFVSSSWFVSACSSSETREQKGHPEVGHKIVVTTPVVKDVVTTQQYVCQIHSRRHIEIRALERGYLEEIRVQEGQAVKRGQVMFRIVPVLYQANLDAELAAAELAEIRFENTQNLSNQSIVSQQELALAKAELTKARARVTRARAELNFTSLKAPFDGIVDRQREQQGSLVEEGDVLSTFSDNQVMWVYFNVPEARYLEYKTNLAEEEQGLDIELQLANGKVFPQPGKIGAIEADFNNETGNIAFRADFPNPDGLLRHGQTGTILIHKKEKDALVIPQRATYEILAKKYVYVVEPAGKGHGAVEGHEAAAEHDGAAASENGGEHEPGGEHRSERSGRTGIVRQREIAIQEELDDLYLIKEGLSVNDRIIFEGIQQVRDGDEIEYELEAAEEILKSLKYQAE